MRRQRCLGVGRGACRAAGPDGSALPGSDHIVTFDGHGSTSFPPARPLLCDPVDLKVDALEKLVISVYLPGPLVAHWTQPVPVICRERRPHRRRQSGRAPRIMPLPALVTQVEVDPVSATDVVVTLGDSITEGAQSTNNAFRGWPDRLAERLPPRIQAGRWSMPASAATACCAMAPAPAPLARLDRDVFSVSGIKAIILLEGINDIGAAFIHPLSR